MRLGSNLHPSAREATVAFRVPVELRDKLFDESYAEGKFLSVWLRELCIEKLKQSAAQNSGSTSPVPPKGLTRPLRLFEKFW